MRETNIAFLFPPEESLKRHLRQSFSDLEQVKFVFPPDEEEENLIRSCREADIIIGWRPTEELIKKSQRFSLFIFPGTGVNSLVEIFKKLKREPNPVLINTHGNSYAVAQHAVAILLALTNRIGPHHSLMMQGKWYFGDDQMPSTPLRNRHVGFLGYGAINSKVHRFLAGFELTFSALKRDWNDFDKALPTALNKYESSQLQAFLKAIDILIIALPATSQTDGMLGDVELKLLGQTGLLVNVARGKIVGEEHLYWALNRGYIAGAALDVWYNYAPEADKVGRQYPFSYPFHKLKNVVLSPHRAASPFNDIRQWADIIENIRRFASGENDFINVVDLEKEY